MLKRLTVSAVKYGALKLRLAELAGRRYGGNAILEFHVVPAEDAESFEETVHFLMDQLEVVPVADIVREAKRSTGHSTNGLVAMTFDDGLRNHYEVVYPILKRLSLPATFYVCPGMLGQSGSIWTWETWTRLKRMSDDDRRGFLELSGGATTPGALVEWMKKIPVSERENIQSEIMASDPSFEFTPAEEREFALMTWEQLVSLDANLITVGSHTLTHVDLPQTRDERLEHELLASRGQLEERLGRAVRHFCYPNGSYDRRSLEAVARHFESAVTTQSGCTRRGDNPLELKRISGEYSISRLNWSIMMESWRRRPAAARV